MREFIEDRIDSEDGAETVEIIIGIVVFVIFGITVFGMITNVAGNKMEDIAKCLGNSGTVLANSNGNAAETCAEYTAGQEAGAKADYKQGK